MELNISNIQHFSVGDGDGIRTTVFFKGCNLSCPWCHNPENLTAEPVELHYAATGKAELRGKIVTVEEILPELLEDKDFYETSGGGVTLSGGEVMLQADGVSELAGALVNENVSVAIDTAGLVPYTEFEKLRGLVSEYLYDFKTADPVKYKNIGGILDVVADNLSRLIADGENVRVRIPLIPGFNTDYGDVSDMCRCLNGMGITHVDILPYHRLGSSKYEAMGMEYSYKDTAPMTRDELEGIVAVFKDHFETVTVQK